MPEFPYKTPPLPYQRPILQATAGQTAHFLAMEQGTGKTYITLNTAAYLFLKQRIVSMVVLAPNGVHAQWIYDQVPRHVPEVIRVQPYLWRSSYESRQAKKRNKPLSESMESLLNTTFDGTTFPILAVNSEALGAVTVLDKILQRFLRKGPSLLVVDESSDFAAPTNKRTRVLLRLGRMARYRRCLDGTPVGSAPWDLWAPYTFLDTIALGYKRYRDMQDAHAEWVEFQRGDTGRTFRVLKTDKGQPVYKDLGVLKAKCDPITTRVTKATVLPHLPPKHFAKHYFELTTEQTRLMQEIRESFVASLTDTSTASATNVLGVLLRCQQVAHGYVPVDPDWSANAGEPLAEPEHYLTKGNPRLDVALEQLEQLQRYGQTLVWTRFRYDAKVLALSLQARDIPFGIYDGSTPQAERDAMVQAFQREELATLILNPAAAARGLDLWRASSALYYGNYFGLRRRLQSEDRAHRIGTTRQVRYVDLVGVDPFAKDPLKHSPDHKIVRTLRANKNLADILTGDPHLTDWL